MQIKFVYGFECIQKREREREGGSGEKEKTAVKQRRIILSVNKKGIIETPDRGEVKLLLKN